MATIEITSANFQAEAVESDKPVVLDFWAVWCGPCQMVGPVVEELSEEHPEIKFGEVNTDQEMMLAQQFGIMSIPTLILFKEGKPVSQLIGAQPNSALESFATQ